MRIVFKSRFLILLVFILFSVSAGSWFLTISLRSIPSEKIPIVFTINPGDNLNSIATNLTDLGILKNTKTFIALVKVMGHSKNLMAGTYKIRKSISHYSLIKKITNGDFAMGKILFREGITFREMMSTIYQHPDIRVKSKNMAIATLLNEIGASEAHPEGIFFPDTYNFTSGTSDLQILKLAYKKQKEVLNRLWANRNKKVPLDTPYDALILASIFEKETGDVNEREIIGEVFINRLNKRIKLQADPTVIYGIGDKFNGNLRKKDLIADTAYNTYTRYGLPPTPIALPGEGSIEAVLNPSNTGSLYFVSKGDGTHYFSKTLREHNLAVNKYQRRRNAR